MTENLLDIPAFLRVGTPENIKAREEGAARLAVAPSAPKPRQLGLNFIKEKKVGTGQRGSTAKVTHTTRAANDIVRDHLRQLGYSTEFCATVGIKKAKEIIEDIRTGKGATREDQA